MMLHRSTVQYNSILSLVVGTFLIMLLTASLWASKYTLTQLLMYKTEQLNLFYDQHMHDAHGQMTALKEQLALVEEEQCNSELIELLRQQMYDRDEYYVPMVYIKNQALFCSALGAMPTPENIVKMSTNVAGLGLYTIKYPDGNVKVFVGIDDNDVQVFRRLLLGSRFKTLLKNSWFLSGAVIKVGEHTWFTVGATHERGQMVHVDSDETPLAFTLSSSQQIKNHLWLFYFVLMLAMSSFVAWLIFQARGALTTRYWQHKFTKALNNEEFKLEFQPVFNTRTSEVAGAETFLRWQHKGHQVPTVDFIDKLEHSPAMVAVTLWVIESALRELKSLLVSGKLRWCSINISAQDIESGSVLSMLDKWQQQGYPLASINFELTERLPISDWPQAQEFVAACQHYGCGVKLDDVGTGYGSHLYLQQLPFNAFKIDRAFVSLLGLAESKLSLVTTYVDIAKEMQADVIAEGVETQEQAEILQELGIYLHQGWYYARSMDADELRRFILTR